jgi:hypothetical protein
MRQPRKTVVKGYNKTQIELKLQEELECWRKAEYVALGFTETFVGPQMLMSDETLDRLVDLAHAGAIRGPEQLVREVDWVFSDKYARTLVELIHRFILPPPITSKQQDGPNLQSSGPRDDDIQSATHGVEVRQPKSRVCRRCCQPGHNGEIVFIND